ncbi:unnamed protein product, partial [Prorocentrum cordatum]
GGVESGVQWLQVMKKAKMSPSVGCYTAIIDACDNRGSGAADSDYQRASQLVDQMLNSGLALNTQAYNVALRTKAKAAETSALEALLDRMEANYVIPDDSSYASVIRSRAEAGDAMSAERWLAEMGRRGARPGEAAYAEVLRAWADVGNDKGIRRTLAAMSDEGVELTAPAATTPSSVPSAGGATSRARWTSSSSWPRRGATTTGARTRRSSRP